MIKQLIKKVLRSIWNSRLLKLYRRSRLREEIKARQLAADPRKFSNRLFKKHYKRDINWNNPEMLDEKLMILNSTVYYKNQMIIDCADKYRVREYVESCGLKHILNDLYGVWNTPEEINIDELPNSFALKKNNDAGGVLVVRDKKTEENLEEKIAKLGKNQNRKHGICSGESHYQYIKPCIICEKYIGEEDGRFPYDYKFYCMNGEVRCALICVDREKKDEVLGLFVVDRNFQIDSEAQIMSKSWEKQYKTEDILKYRPKLWDELMATAEILSKPFPFVRVDLYEFQNRILFGELTFTPRGCIHDYFSMEGEKLLGSWLDISER